MHNPNLTKKLWLFGVIPLKLRVVKRHVMFIFSWFYDTLWKSSFCVCMLWYNFDMLSYYTAIRTFWCVLKSILWCMFYHISFILYYCSNVLFGSNGHGRDYCVRYLCLSIMYVCTVTGSVVPIHSDITNQTIPSWAGKINVPHYILVIVDLLDRNLITHDNNIFTYEHKIVPVWEVWTCHTSHLPP